MMINSVSLQTRSFSKLLIICLFIGVALISACSDPEKKEEPENITADSVVVITAASPTDTGTISQVNDQQEQQEQIVVNEEKVPPVKEEKKAPVVTEKKSTEVQKGPTGIAGIKWKLVELGGTPVHQEDIKNQVLYIMFDSTEKRVYGFGGCNQFFGEYQVEETLQIKFKKMTTTMMACDRMELESQFISIFEDVDNYSMNQKFLTLNKAKMAPLARFEVSK